MVLDVVTVGLGLGAGGIGVLAVDVESALEFTRRNGSGLRRPLDYHRLAGSEHDTRQGKD